MADSSSASTESSTGPVQSATGKAVCPKGHQHEIALDFSGFEIYGFLLIFGMPCKFNRFRLQTTAV
jgi:hypothetical protein